MLQSGKCNSAAKDREMNVSLLSLLHRESFQRGPVVVASVVIVTPSTVEKAGVEEEERVHCLVQGVGSGPLKEIRGRLLVLGTAAYVTAQQHRTPSVFPG